MPQSLAETIEPEDIAMLMNRKLSSGKFYADGHKLTPRNQQPHNLSRVVAECCDKDWLKNLDTGDISRGISDATLLRGGAQLSSGALYQDNMTPVGQSHEKRYIDTSDLDIQEILKANKVATKDDLQAIKDTHALQKIAKIMSESYSGKAFAMAACAVVMGENTVYDARARLDEYADKKKHMVKASDMLDATYEKRR